jgi:Xaa-Pro aminopeptidase
MTTILYSGYYDSDKEVYPFEIDPNFYYLTSCDLPNVTILHHAKKDYVYVDIPNPVFYDVTHFKRKLKLCFKADIIDLKDLLLLLQSSKDIQTLPNIKTHPHFSKFKRFHMDTTSIASELSNKREIKFPDEILAIEEACKYTSGGIKQIMKSSYLGMNQLELVGIFKHYLSTFGIQELSFNPITSHARDNSILHYEATNKRIKHNTLILLDVGCKYNHYCSDISRTFPLSGKFSEKSKLIYQAVLHTLKYALRLMKPKAQWQTITHKVKLKLYDECLKINLVDKVDNDSDKLQVISTLMPHSLGHHVGLETHDCGPITTLQANMVIAVEPGLYFQVGQEREPFINKKTWKELANLGGVRIEDTIVITSKGHKNLSKVPKEMSAIENLMK